MKLLSLNEIIVDLSSYVDPNGFVFNYKDKVYRAINSEKESFFRNLFEQGIIDKLCKDCNLVKSNISNYAIPEINCNLVIEHERIKPLTYCVEWPPTMMKTAALSTLELNLALLEYDCILQDAYPWNILFDATKPVFIDLTSIVPTNKSELLWSAYQQFINFFQYPLIMNSMQKGKIGRLLLFDYINGVSLKDLINNYSCNYFLSQPLSVIVSKLSQVIVNLLQRNEQLKVKFQKIVKQKTKSRIDNELRKKFIKNLINKTKKIPIREDKSTWNDYYKKIDDSFKLRKKESIVNGLLNNLRPKTVLDIGCNIGKFSIIAAKSGARVISMDSDEASVELLYKVAQKEAYYITPIIGDILNPTPPYGFLSKQFPPLIQRIKSDVVLCLALMHHLHINGRQSFDRIALILNEVAYTAVIFEYVDCKDKNINLLDHGRDINYSFETVTRALEKYFKLSFFESDCATRKIILCEK